MARRTDRLLDQPDTRVVVVDGRGKYLAEDVNGLFFTDQRAQALVFRYVADRVQEQIDALRKEGGIVLTADPLLPEEVYEICDRCKDLFLPQMTYFDGKLFLCADCRKNAKSSRPRSADPSAQASA